MAHADEALDYVTRFYATTESSYSYRAVDQACKTTTVSGAKSTVGALSALDFSYTANTAAAIMQAVHTKGPMVSRAGCPVIYTHARACAGLRRAC